MRLLSWSLVTFLLLGCGKGFKTADLSANKAESLPGDILTGPVMFGVSLSGAEFGSAMPGVHGTDYSYPPVSSLDYWKSKGLLLVRLPVRWERVQNALMGPLNALELARIRDFVREAGERQMNVILELHNSGYYNGFALGSGDVPVAAFKDLWSKLSAELAQERGLYGYGLMRAPNGLNGQWPAAAQAGVDGVRVGDKLKKIFVGGEGGSNASTWRALNENLNVRDPSGNLVYEAHVYFDQDGSGSYLSNYDGEGASDAVGVERLKPFADWLAAGKRKGFVAEYGVPGNDARWNVALSNMLSYMRDSCIAGTYWAAGPLLGAYSLSVEPTAGVDKPQVDVLKNFTGNINCQY